MPRKLEHQIYTEIHELRQRQKNQRTKTLIFMLFIALMIGASYWIRSKPPAQKSTASNIPIPETSLIPIPEPSLKALPLPLSGTITPVESDFGRLRLFLSPPVEADNSKLENQCPANTSFKKNDLNYFIKVVDWETNKTITTAFIRAGETVTLNLPSGNYKLRYAAGVEWYGNQDWFGKKTRFGEVADSMTLKPLQFKFERQGATWDLGLYGCSFGGNTKSKTLKAQDF